MKTVVVSLIFSQLLIPGFSSFTQNEASLAVSLIKHFHIKECALSTEVIDPTVFKVVKGLMYSNRFYTFFTPTANLTERLLTHKRLEKEEDKSYSHSRRIAVLWKTDVYTLIEEMDKVKAEAYRKYSEFIGNVKWDYRKHMEPLHWMVLLKSNDVTDIEKLLHHLHAPYSCMFMVIYELSPGKYQIAATYNIYYDSKTYVRSVGTWNAKNGLEINQNDFHQKRLNLEKETLKLFIFGNIFYNQSKVLSCVYEIWTESGKVLNFSHQQISSYDITTEVRTESFAIFDGFLNLFYWNWKNKRLPGMLTQLWPMTCYMHVKYDGDELTGLGILIRPFSSQLWMFIGVWFFLSTTIIIMTEYVIIKYLHSKERKHKPFNILDSLWTSIYVCLNQGRHDILSNASMRLVYLLLWTKVVILLPCFTAGVVSILTITIPSLPFKNLDEFIEKGTYEMTALRGTFAHTYIANNQDNPKFKFIYENLFEEESKLTINMWEIPDRICSSQKLAFVAWKEDVLNTIEKAAPPCQILRIQNPAFEVSAAMLLGLNNYLSKPFKANLMRFRSSGILFRMQQTIQDVNVAGFQPNRLKPVELKHCIPHFSLFCAGLVFSLFAFLYEMSLNKQLLVEMFQQKKFPFCLVLQNKKSYLLKWACKARLSAESKKRTK